MRWGPGDGDRAKLWYFSVLWCKKKKRLSILWCFCSKATKQQPIIRTAKAWQQPPFQLLELIERKAVLEENEPRRSILHSVCPSVLSWHWIMFVDKSPAETIRIINATFLPTAQNGVGLLWCVCLCVSVLSLCNLQILPSVNKCFILFFFLHNELFPCF